MLWGRLLQSFRNIRDFVTTYILENPYIHIATAIKGSQDVSINLNEAPQNSVRKVKVINRVFQSFSAKYFIHQKCRFRWTDTVCGFKLNSYNCPCWKLCVGMRNCVLQDCFQKVGIQRKIYKIKWSCHWSWTKWIWGIFIASGKWQRK